MNKKYFLVFLVLLIIPIQEAIADNNVLKIIKVTGSLVGGVEDEDFLLPEAVTNQNKTIIFMSINSLAESNAKEFFRSYDFVNNSAIRFHGSNNVPANNIAMDFLAYLVEFTSTSDLFVQNGTVIVDGADVDMEFVTTLSPSVNASNSFFTFDGLTMDHSDLTIGTEEFGIMRVINSTSWGYEPFDAPNTGDTEVRFSVIDWNNPNFIIQNGTGTLTDLELLDTIVPSPAVNRTHTIILVSYDIDDAMDARIRELTITATLNPSNEIEIQREDSGCIAPECIINYRWELITFPTTFATVIHDEVTSTIKTLANVRQSYQDTFSPAVDVSKSIVIGTVHNPMALGNSRTGGGGTGAWDKTMHTIDLINSTAINATVADGSEKPTLTYQVIEFGQVGGQIFNQIVTDTTTNLDETRLITNKTQTDSTSGTDQQQFVVDKSAIDFTVTVDSGQGFNITKAFTDIVVNIDVANVEKIVSQIVADITASFDEVRLTITKAIIDFVTNVETVETQLIKGIDVNDTTTNIDEVNLSTTLKVGGGSGGAGGIGTPLSPVRLIGLNIASELFFVESGDIQASDFAISWFGDDFVGIELSNIEAKDDFVGFNQWFSFSPTPDKLDVERELAFENRLPTDPRSRFNTALDDFTLIIPDNPCLGDLVTVVTANCFNPIIYEVPLEFTFKIKGSEFRTEHIVQIDGRSIIPQCVIFDSALPILVCNTIDFTFEFWWALILVALLFIIIPKFIIPATKRKVRVAHFVRGGRDQDLGDDKISKRLKRLKKVR